MVFSSAPFIFIFLPVVFLVYSIMPGLRFKNVFLTIASLLFYAYGEPLFAIVLVVSVFLNYIFARIISASSGKSAEPAAYEASGDQVAEVPAKGGPAKFVLAISIIMNLALIGVFKYAGFFVETMNDLTRMNYEVPEIALPIGISFFTFQALSYVIDVYRKPDTVQKNFGKVLLYISFFPQLIAGPIVKYHDIAPYLNERKADIDEISGGIQRFVTGLAKKMFLANGMGAVADMMFGLPANDMSAVTAWTGAICYTLQIYFDFSGYSDMAIGIGHMFGFTIKENFDHPYISTSIKMFWRRWHISLSTWFTEYLYIPLGGNRKGTLRTEANKMCVFFLTGLWHGASWNFVIWGMIHGLAITFEDMLQGIWTRLTGRDKDTEARGIAILGRAVLHFFGFFYTIIIVVLAFVLFRADTISDAITMFTNMFSMSLGNTSAYNTCMEVLNPYNITILLVSLFICVPHPFLNKIFREKGPVSYILTLILFGLCVLEIAGASFNPFIYFRF